MSDSYRESSSDHPEGEELAFEFERKFFVRTLPSDVFAHAERTVIAQAYIFASEGYAVRVRLTFPGRSVDFPSFNDEVDLVGAYERRVIAALMAEESEVSATIAVKSPGIAGERYEMESPVDVDVAVQILRRSPQLILKNRYHLWYDEDGWVFDEFGGQNSGLIVAECERLAPVVNLRIPDFCATEVTEDLRFTNDYLSKEPWRQWSHMWEVELSARGPHFMDLRGSGKV